MKKQIAFTIYSVILIIGCVSFYYFGLKDAKTVCNHENALRLEQVQKHKDIIQKTLAVAYPQLSIFEVRAYGEIFYMLTEELYKVPFIKPAAIINIESGWNPTLISWARCRGLGGLSTAAASDGCKKYNIKYREGFTEWYDINNLALSLDYFCSRYESKGDSFAVRSYIGGDTWRRAKPKSARHDYITSYSDSVKAFTERIDSVLNEVKKLDYIQVGVQHHQ